ncbi:CpeT/CpcT family (DUF1001) [Idiomarina sp. A28L]|uniref:chromophore lyase CpcT/CpeT n=1 Tax=Idiomarina sp. A28L TaxID=1036674 RepID=UPI0002138E8D|nr:chromophore lyase CpcT/CpeT [Idiomarina sp. A28L]EGN76282.1 CpeT/CpcT family (DUF1001) [Idiomarina sp. A28L]
MNPNIIKSSLILLFFSLNFTSLSAISADSPEELATPAPSASAKNTSVVQLSTEEQKDKLVNWLTAEFSNLRYVFQFGPIGGYPPVLMRQEQVELFDNETALVVAQSWLAAPNQVYRKHLYRFRIPRRSNEIVQDIYSVPLDFAGALASEDGLSQELELLIGCSIRWQATETGFEGYRDGNRCSFRNEDNQVVSWTTHLTLNPLEYSVADTAFTDDGEQLLGDIDGKALVVNRIRFFQAEIGYLPAGANADDLQQWMVAAPQRPLHDHEQRIPLLSSEDGLFLGHEVQLISDLNDSEKLQLRLYRQTEDEPMFQVEMEYMGEGKWSATGERLRIQISKVDSVTELLPQH